MATPVCTVDETGIHRPTEDEVFTYFENGYRGIYGADLYLDPDSQDGQFLSLLAQAIHDVNGEAVALYNSFSPTTAQGTGLSTLVRLNGIARGVATYSVVDLRVVGQAGTTIVGGVARGDDGTLWLLPSTVIPTTGEILVTARASLLGAYEAPPGSITEIATITRGWQSVSNPTASVPGEPVESDPELRIRQAQSTMLPSHSVLEGMVGALLAAPGVTRLRVYENDTDVVDENGIPGHSVAAEVEGGDVSVLSTVIQRKKGVGAGTYGDTSTVVYDDYGIPHDVSLFRPTDVPVAYYIALRPRRGYTVAIEDGIRTALAAWTEALGIGEPLTISRAYTPALGQGSSYEIVSLVATRDGLPPPVAPQDVPVEFTERLTCTAADVHIQVVS